jgi:hypothetical protein
MTELKQSEVIPSIIAAAVAAAGPMGNNEGQWRAKINRAIPYITAMLNDGSRQWRTAVEVLEAHVFTGRYVRHEIEESSTRTILYVDVGRPSDNYPDGIENISCHRTDNAAGKEQLARLERLEPGDELVMWRAMEEIKGTNKSRRTLVHFETRPKRKERTEVASTPPREQRGMDRAEEQSAPEPARQPATYSDKIDTERIQAWRARVRETLTEAELHELMLDLSKSGFDFDGVSEIEWVDHVRPLIQGIINRRGTS